MINILNKFTEDVIVIKFNGEIKFCNDKLLFKLGYKSNEIEKNNLSKLLKDNSIYEKILNFKNSPHNEEEVDFFMYSKGNKKLRYKGILSLENWNEEKAIFIICKEIKDELYTKEDLENFIENAPFMCSLKDLDGKYVLINKLGRQGFEEKLEDIIGKHDRDILISKDCERTVKDEKYVIETKRPFTSEKYVRKENGYVRWVKVYKMPVVDSSGKVKYIGTVSNDISLRKNIEVNLDNSYEKTIKKNNNLLDNNSTDIMESYQRLDKIQDNLVKCLNAEGINIWIYYDDVEELISEFRSGLSHEIAGDDLKIKITENDFYNTMLIDNFEGIKLVEKDSLYLRSDYLLSHGVKYQGLYKISFNNKVVGILSLIYKDNEPDFSQEFFIKNMCNELGIIIKNETLSNELRREFNKRIEVEKELAEFLNIATDIMTVLDEDGNIIKINNEATISLGWNIEELTSMKWQDIIDPEYLEVTYDSVNEAINEPYVAKGIVNRYINKSGKYIWLDWRYKYFKDTKLLVCTAKNITEEKKMAEEKLVYEKSLQLESIKNEFFSNISHEFKTPLNIILATMQLINKGVENNKIEIISELDLKRYFNSIRQNSYRLLRLVNNFIDMTRIDSGYYNINLENNNIVSIIEDITMSVAQFVEDKGITLIFDTEIEEEVIACDPDKIERIMLNLLSNAIKYTKSDGQIDVNISVKDNNIAVSVKDDGIGIPKENVLTIFDRFVQVDNQVTRKCQGSGIGLALVKSLVQLHDGSISVNSEENKGTEFIFELPIKTIETNNEVNASENNIGSKIEKCIIEFSDVYR